MPHLSKLELDKSTEIELLASLETALVKINKTGEMNTFLFSLLSHTERLMLGKRLGIVLLLQQGIEETVIAKILHVTRQTVYRIKHSSQYKNSGYKIALKAIKNEKKAHELKDALLRLARYSVRAAGGRVKTNIFD